MAPMQTERCRFSLNELNGLLYAIGGANEQDTFEIEHGLCEVYNPKNDTWKTISNLPELRSQHAGASIKVKKQPLLIHLGGTW